MREIKFDAIYKPTGEHFVPIDINFNDKSLTGNFDGNPNDWCHFSLDGKYGDVILREHTGLKDKNDQDIYEGDVFQREGFPKYYVSFEKGSFVAVPIDEVQRVNWEHYPLSNMYIRFSEVIGNIYENPELLADN